MGIRMKFKKDVKTKTLSLKLIFLGYLLNVGIVLVCSVLLSFFTLNILFYLELVIPANYTENIIKKRLPKMEKTIPFSESLIPSGTSYLLISKDGKKLKSNMEEKEEKKAINFHKTKIPHYSIADNYLEIKRKDGYLIIHYSLAPHYVNVWMEKNLPNANYLLIVFISLLFIFSTFATTLLWAKKLAKELKPLLKATKEIEDKNLDFNLDYSHVKEFNAVLKGLEDMKQALSDSLKKQWRQDEYRKEQISSLTHDLKTPIFVIQGNLELLKETNMNEEQKIYIEYIVKNINRIANYAHSLRMIDKEESLNKISFQEISAKQFAKQIEMLGKEILPNDRLNVFLDVKDERILLDVNLLERAIQNILMNACEYSFKNTMIDIIIKTHSNFIEIKVRNEGKGFTKKDLMYAHELFYRGDDSRHSNHNLGLGLYIVSKIITLHKGQLKCENWEKGASVTLSIPYIF